MSKFRHWPVLFLFLIACSDKETKKCDVPDLDLRQEMRDFVQEISAYAKDIDPDFLIVPQNGQEILTTNSDPDGPLATDYMDAIDAVGREDLFYGYTGDDKPTPAADRDFLISICDVARENGKLVMVTDYCSTHSKMDDSYNQNEAKGYVSFAADHRELNNIPAYPATIHHVNDNDITSAGEVKNFLYLINPSFSTKQQFIEAVQATNYDLVLVDLYFNEEELTAADVEALKTKANGGSRLVICYMSIGEAEDYRYYWSDLDKNLVCRENPDWKGNFAVKYWEADWKSVIYGNEQSYLKKILNAGFNGVYLDIIEAYETFE
ncbi:MAG TPA: endo alpha-1,4 polygalactosaminidase [Cyclobacteriaceae bacterium]|nr:endo alpha-1,4 polygalactosaminidase [Cyclobacteriaceae bacterium]HMV08272.1 endo alpha-1,4 polygalactosaminidase [Cyclobacteriaceae bacterium]HMV90276.1 endo alpha-1,4 polygalactosaminidase [Cyclobacteriaceae bacterium]HMX02115.1 endo alpha-1,4 polygalactosaminidase [Cyclobacteriaceae bacterium]HMX49909.1 endo alpha-1,4 polygalactosaminidase [Cyclobacteriaceae bacterium]